MVLKYGTTTKADTCSVYATVHVWLHKYMCKHVFAADEQLENAELTTVSLWYHLYIDVVTIPEWRSFTREIIKQML